MREKGDKCSVAFRGKKKKEYLVSPLFTCFQEFGLIRRGFRFVELSFLSLRVADKGPLQKYLGWLDFPPKA